MHRVDTGKLPRLRSLHQCSGRNRPARKPLRDTWARKASRGVR